MDPNQLKKEVDKHVLPTISYRPSYTATLLADKETPYGRKFQTRSDGCIYETGHGNEVNAAAHCCHSTH